MSRVGIIATEAPVGPPSRGASEWECVERMGRVVELMADEQWARLRHVKVDEVTAERMCAAYTAARDACYACSTGEPNRALMHVLSVLRDTGRTDRMARRWIEYACLALATRHLVYDEEGSEWTSAAYDELTRPWRTTIGPLHWADAPMDIASESNDEPPEVPAPLLQPLASQPTTRALPRLLPRLRRAVGV